MSSMPAGDGAAGRSDGRGESSDERADRNWEEMMQELRVMQTGTQILTGFLLAVAFQPLFQELTESQRVLYILLVLLAATATILALAPVGMHRVLFGRRRKTELVHAANRIVKANLVVIAAVTVGVTMLIIDVTFTRTFALIAGGAGILAIICLWVLWPLFLRRRR
ncbi:sodium:proton antiporter [Microbacterium esteraromaticum]|uniref:Sodium:proton antiporter n=1 Tax=Microbacterium esteraromaticum TaxID=57043 RepID=A0A939DWM9_9MICO|nr:DUF6328 family protein [Microbacterium esteraromaticum]MBN8205607.1 sodium:proton antiporter [Microbacterium esteraromaticum]MBN8415761.1 sodium:proton antiporter [Microbacterium esteraromaticum]